MIPQPPNKKGAINDALKSMPIPPPDKDSLLGRIPVRVDDAKKQIERVKTKQGEDPMGRDMKKPGPPQSPIEDEG
jgi:hypothetical protein